MELLKNKYSYIYLLLGVASAIGFFIIKDYITSLLLGSFIALITYPLFKLFQAFTVKLHWKSFLNLFYKNKSEIDSNKAIAAVLTVLTTIGLVVLSVYLVGLFAGNNLKFIFQQPIETQVVELVQNPAFKERFQGLYDEKDLKDRIGEFFNQYKPSKLLSLQGSKLIENSENRVTAQRLVTILFTNVFNFFIYFVVFMFTWIIMLVTGRELLQFCYQFTFLTEDEQKTINQDISSGVKNVIIGNVVSGLLIAFMVAFIGLYFKIPLVSVWAILAFFIGFLPLSPSEAAFIPVLTGIFFTKGITTLIIVAVLLEIYILILNNIVLPKITAGKETNPLLILISVFTAINIFGITGFVIGPVFVYFMMALYKIADNRLEILKNEKKTI